MPGAVATVAASRALTSSVTAFLRALVRDGVDFSFRVTEGSNLEDNLFIEPEQHQLFDLIYRCG